MSRHFDKTHLVSIISQLNESMLEIIPLSKSFCIFFYLLFSAGVQTVYAQDWNMVVTKTDNIKVKLPISEIKDVSFILSEDNVINLEHDLRVLVMGNSYALDATAYLDELVKAAHINSDQLGVYIGVFNGGGLEEWVKRYKFGPGTTLNKMAGSVNMITEGSVKDLLSQTWDVIVILQSSDKSYDWDSFEQSLPELLDIIKSNCPNEDVIIGYQLPWGHTESSAIEELAGNIDCAIKMMEKYEVKLMIPVGVAVQNARNTSLNTPLYLTRDNWHLCMGVGRYVAACTFFESVISPMVHISVLGNTATHSLSDDERNKYTGSVAVDIYNRFLCQKCAYYAVKNPLQVAFCDNNDNEE